MGNSRAKTKNATTTNDETDELDVVAGERVSILGRSSSFVGTVKLQRKLSGESSWDTVTQADGTEEAWTDTGFNCTYEADEGCILKLVATTVTSGTIYLRTGTAQ